MGHRLLTDLRAKQKDLKAEAEGIYALAETEQAGELTSAQEQRLAAIDAEIKKSDGEIDAAIAVLEPEADNPQTPPAATGSAADVEAETKRAADIVAACKLAGQSDKAAGFITDKKSLSEVVASLQADRVSGSLQEVHSGHTSKQEADAGWDDVAEKVNATLGVKPRA